MRFEYRYAILTSNIQSLWEHTYVMLLAYNFTSRVLNRINRPASEGPTKI